MVRDADQVSSSAGTGNSSPGPRGPALRWNRAGAMRTARRRLDLNQRELARVLDLAAATIARAETAGGAVSLAVLEAILEMAGLRLAVVDELGHVVEPEPEDVVRNHGRRRLPAHLDAEVRDPSAVRQHDYSRRRPLATYRHRPRRDLRRQQTQFIAARHPVFQEAAWFALPPMARRQRLNAFLAGTGLRGGLPDRLERDLAEFARSGFAPAGVAPSEIPYAGVDNPRDDLAPSAEAGRSRPYWLDQLVTSRAPVPYWVGRLFDSPCCSCSNATVSAA